MRAREVALQNAPARTHAPRLPRIYMEHRDKEGTRLRRIWTALAALLLLAGQAAAQEADRTPMAVYVEAGAMDAQTAQRLVALLSQAFPQGAWVAELGEGSGRSLRDLVLADDTPQLAICSPASALPWVREGLIAAPGTVLPQARMMAGPVVAACEHEGELFMLPVRARHRQTAVNRSVMQARRMDYLLDGTEHAVWYPSELYQVLEECALAGTPGMEIWPEDGGALMAMVQSLYGGPMLTDDGEAYVSDDSGALEGLAWLDVMVHGGLIGVAESREAALSNFLGGKTAIFIDWTDEESREYAAKTAARSIVEMPYPTALGMPVRAFELTGVAVFAQGDARQRALALSAAMFLHEDAQAQIVLGDRAIWRDDCMWLPCLRAGKADTLLGGLFEQAVREMIAGEATAREAMALIRAGMGR